MSALRVGNSTQGVHQIDESPNLHPQEVECEISDLPGRSSVDGPKPRGIVDGSRYSHFPLPTVRSYAQPKKPVLDPQSQRRLIFLGMMEESNEALPSSGKSFQPPSEILSCHIDFATDNPQGSILTHLEIAV